MTKILASVRDLAQLIVGVDGLKETAKPVFEQFCGAVMLIMAEHPHSDKIEKDPKSLDLAASLDVEASLVRKLMAAGVGAAVILVASKRDEESAKLLFRILSGMNKVEFNKARVALQSDGITSEPSGGDGKSLFLPPREILRVVRAKVAASTKLTDHWWIPEYQARGSWKPSYGWAVGRPPIVVKSGGNFSAIVSWSLLDSLSLDQLLGHAPCPDAVIPCLGTSGKLFNLAHFGNAWFELSNYTVAGKGLSEYEMMDSVFGPVIAANEHLEVAHDVNDFRAKMMFKTAVPLDDMMDKPMVKRFKGPDGDVKAMIVGFAFRPEFIESQDVKVVGDASVVVEAIGVTDRTPDAIEQLEFALESYLKLYSRWVEPARGKPIMGTPGSDHTFVKPSDWARVDPANMPPEIDGVPPEDMFSGVDEACRFSLRTQ